MIGLPPSILGFGVSGDLADFTIYTDRYGRKIAYPASPPRVAASPLQTYQRSRFTSSMLAWTRLSADAKAAYSLACARLSLPCTATSLWCSLSLARSDELFKTIQRQARLRLVRPPRI